MCIYRELLTRQIDHQSPHPFIDLPIMLLTLLLIWLLALFFLFWLGSAAGHRSHTPTTTPFQYPKTDVTEGRRVSEMKIWCRCQARYQSRNTVGETETRKAGAGQQAGEGFECFPLKDLLPGLCFSEKNKTKHQQATLPC